MSKLITERELMSERTEATSRDGLVGSRPRPDVVVGTSKQSDPTGVTVFGYSQVDEAFRLWRDMLPQERRVLADRMAAHNAEEADKFMMLLSDAVYVTGHYDQLPDAPEPGSERFTHTERMLRFVFGDEWNVENEPESTESA